MGNKRLVRLSSVAIASALAMSCSALVAAPPKADAATNKASSAYKVSKSHSYSTYGGGVLIDRNKATTKKVKAKKFTSAETKAASTIAARWERKLKEQAKNGEVVAVRKNSKTKTVSVSITPGLSMMSSAYPARFADKSTRMGAMTSFECVSKKLNTNTGKYSNSGFPSADVHMYSWKSKRHIIDTYDFSKKGRDGLQMTTKSDMPAGHAALDNFFAPNVLGTDKADQTFRLYGRYSADISLYTKKQFDKKLFCNGGVGTATAKELESSSRRLKTIKVPKGYSLILSVSSRPDIKAASASKISDKAYTGKQVTPKPKLKCRGKVLKAGKDYTLSYSNNVNCGTAQIIVKGKGKYQGSKTIKFKIKGTDISKAKFEDKADVVGTARTDAVGKTKAFKRSIPFNAREHGVCPTAVSMNGKLLELGKDFEVSSNAATMTAPGTATLTIKGIGAYTGKKTLKYTVTKGDMSFAQAAKVPALEYTGNPVKPTLQISIAKPHSHDILKTSQEYRSDELRSGIDYKVSYYGRDAYGDYTIPCPSEGPTEPGEYMAYATGHVRYAGTLKVPFRIMEPGTAESVWVKFDLNADDHLLPATDGETPAVEEVEVDETAPATDGQPGNWEDVFLEDDPAYEPSTGYSGSEAGIVDASGTMADSPSEAPAFEDDPQSGIAPSEAEPIPGGAEAVEMVSEAPAVAEPTAFEDAANMAVDNSSAFDADAAPSASVPPTMDDGSGFEAEAGGNTTENLPVAPGATSQYAGYQLAVLTPAGERVADVAVLPNGETDPVKIAPGDYIAELYSNAPMGYDVQGTVHCTVPFNIDAYMTDTSEASPLRLLFSVHYGAVGFDKPEGAVAHIGEPIDELPITVPQVAANHMETVYPDIVDNAGTDREFHLVPNVDFTVERVGVPQVGNGNKMIVTGIGTYAGTREIEYSITPAQLNADDLRFHFDGSALMRSDDATPALTLQHRVYGGDSSPRQGLGESNLTSEYTDLVEGLDYRVEYEHPQIALVIAHVHGLASDGVPGARFSGDVDLQFTLFGQPYETSMSIVDLGARAAEGAVEIAETTLPFNRSATAPYPSHVSVDGVELQAGRDFLVRIASYDQKFELGMPLRAELFGVGAYKGTVPFEYSIVQADLSNGYDCGIMLDNENGIAVPRVVSTIEAGDNFALSAVSTALGMVILDEGVDFDFLAPELSEDGSSVTLTAVGKGNFTGQISRTFTVDAAGNLSYMS